MLFELIQTVKGSPRMAEGFPFVCSPFEHVSGHPLFGLKRQIHQRLKVIQTERSSIAPFPRLIPPFSLTFCQIVALMLHTPECVDGDLRHPQR